MNQSNAGTRTATIDGVSYNAHRHFTEAGDGTGQIELQASETGRPVARINYNGVDRAMQIETLEGPVARTVVEQLMTWADEWLA